MSPGPDFDRPQGRCAFSGNAVLYPGAGRSGSLRTGQTASRIKLVFLERSEFLSMKQVPQENETSAVTSGLWPGF